MNVHTGNKPYKCEECHKSFSYESALRYHRFTHKDVKQFSCPECHKTFSHKSGLRVHARIHQGIRQFQCTECGRAFSQKQALKRHERTHKGDKPFGCKLCGRTFSDASIVRRHLRLVHKVHKDSKTWREDVDYSPSTLGQGSLALSLDAKQTVEHSTNFQEKAPANSASAAKWTSWNHSLWCPDGGDLSSSQSDTPDAAWNQKGAPESPDQAARPWVIKASQPHTDSAPLEPQSMPAQASTAFPQPDWEAAFPGTLPSVHRPPLFSPLTSQSGETAAGQQRGIGPSSLHTHAELAVRVLEEQLSS